MPGISGGFLNTSVALSGPCFVTNINTAKVVFVVGLLLLVGNVLAIDVPAAWQKYIEYVLAVLHSNEQRYL